MKKSEVTREKTPLLAPVMAIALLGIAGADHAYAALSLEEAIGLAQKKSEEALLLEEKDRRLQSQKRELWAGALPSIQAYANAGRGAQPLNTAMFGAFAGGGSDTGTAPSIPPAYNVEQDTYTYGIQVTQPLYSFGRLGQAFSVAGQTIDAQARSKTRSLQEIQLQAMDAWYSVVTSKARLDVLDASLKRQKETVAFMESNFKMGSGLRSQVLLAVATLKGLEPERIRAEQTATSSAMMLNRLLGRDITEPVEPDTGAHLNSLDRALVKDEATVKNAVESRPDMQAMRLQKEALFGTARGYRMQHRPSLGLSGKLGILAYETDQLTEFDQNKDWSVGVGLTWNLFDGLATTSKAQQIESDARTLEITETKIQKMVRIEIETAFEERDAADSAYQAADQAVAAAREAVELLTQDFRAGKGAVTDLLQAEEGLRNAEFGVLNARYQLARSRAALRVALGMDLLNQETP